MHLVACVRLPHDRLPHANVQTSRVHRHQRQHRQSLPSPSPPPLPPPSPTPTEKQKSKKSCRIGVITTQEKERLLERQPRVSPRCVLLFC